MDDKKKKTFKFLMQIALVIIGLTTYALGTTLFILPMDMIAAGTTGFALVAEHYLHIPIPVFIAIFNISMFVLGWIEIGKEFAFSTLVATFYFPFIMDQTMRLVGDTTITMDPMLCAIFAGIIIGFSLGIVIKAGASTGGTDIPPIVLHKRFKIPVSVTLYLIDFIVLTLQMTFQDIEKVLYALVMVVVYTSVIDRVLMTGTKQMQVKIISDKFEEISEMIQEKLDRGTTLIHIEGGHTHKETRAVLVVVSGRELTKLNNLVMQEDEKAFIIVNQVGEVRGRGFTLSKDYK